MYERKNARQKHEKKYFAKSGLNEKNVENKKGCATEYEKK